MSVNPADFLTKKIREIPPSGIRKFFDLAADMKDVISLGVGEPDFVTPKVIRDAAITSINAGETAYTANYGLIELRRAISKYLAEKIDVEYDPATEIMVTVGGSEAVDITLRAIIEPGDEVIIPEPAFVSYNPCVDIAGGVPVAAPTSFEDGFKVTPELLEKHITPKTKAILLNFPCNPTGAIMTCEELQGIADICIKHNLLAISDEIYAELTYEGQHSSIAALDGMKERTVIVSGVSKTFAMTGWRIGYLTAPKELIQDIAKVHQFALMCAPTMGQKAAVAAFDVAMPEVKKMVAEYGKRRKYIVERFRNMGLDIHEPMGAFYAFPSIKSTGLNSEEFCERLLYEQKVAVVPGSAFGGSGQGFIRCSYAASMENITKACDKMEAFLQNLK